jgi:uncharacterized protein
VSRARSGSHRRLAAAGAVLGAGLLWSTVLEPRRLVVVERSVLPPRWPAFLDGLRIACVSDLHAGAPHVGPGRVAEVVERVNALEPELVALLGDFVDPNVLLGGRIEPERVASVLAGLRAPAFAVIGNHDYDFGPGRVAAALRRAGVTALVNEAASHRGLRIAGLDDPTEGRPNLAFLADEREPMLVLSHDPDLFPRLPATATLTLSGHTHGGQVNLPFLRPRVTPSRFGDRYARGVSRHGDKLLFVTSGLGTSRWPVRLLRPPEIALVTVRAPQRS